MLRIFNNLGKREMIYILFGFALIVFGVFLDLKMPDYMSEITRLVQTEGSKIEDILYNGSFMLLCALGSLFASIAVGYLFSYVSSTFSKNTRKKLFDKVESLSLLEIKKFEVSSLITRTTNDITQVEMFLSMGLQLLIKAPITAIWAITKILNKNITWSMITALAVIVLLSVVGFVMVLVVPRFKKIQKLTDNINASARENLTGIRVVHAFNAENYQEEKFAKTNAELTKIQTFNQKGFALFSPVMYFVMHFLSLSIYFLGAGFIESAKMTSKLSIFSDMIVFSSYSTQVIMSFLMLAFIFMMLPRATVSIKRINEVLDEDASIKDGTGVNTTLEKGTVEFRNVSFKYPDADEYLLRDISFKIEKGKTLAIIGSTGSGKTSLVNLIPRFYDATIGDVLVDGVNVKDYKLESLYEKIGYVSQKAVLFSGDIKSNITFGSKDKDDSEKIESALSISKSLDFVSNLNDKELSHVAQGGTNYSGGQKQRLSIARAIYKDPEIFIFDDSFSALDFKTDKELRSNLKKKFKDKTNIIVAQRIGTILNADKIMVLEDGKCVGFGNHKELLENCSVYREIALSQITEEELLNA